MYFDDDAPKWAKVLRCLIMVVLVCTPFYWRERLPVWWRKRRLARAERQAATS